MLGYESAVVNGQLVNVAPAAAYNPLTWGPVYTGAAWQRQGVYVAPPVTPNSDSSGGAFGGENSFAQPGPTATSASGNPLHLTKSPVLWVLAFFLGSILLLHFVHYK